MQIKIYFNLFKEVIFSERLPELPSKIFYGYRKVRALVQAV